MFPLKNRQLIRGCQAHINAGLGCGADYVADFDNLYLPFSGQTEWVWGTQGGNWYKVTRENGDRIEMAHNSELITLDAKEGDLIAITGNTGSVTTGAHLHIQIFDKNNNRLDPEVYDWGQEDNMSEPCYASRDMTVGKIKKQLDYTYDQEYAGQGGVVKPDTQAMAELYADDNINLAGLRADQIKTDFFKVFIRKVDCEAAIAEAKENFVGLISDKNIEIGELNSTILNKDAEIKRLKDATCKDYTLWDLIVLVYHKIKFWEK